MKGEDESHGNLTPQEGTSMSRQTLFRQQRNIQRLHQLATSVENNRKKKLHYLKASSHAMIKLARGLLPEHGKGRP